MQLKMNDIEAQNTVMQSELENFKQKYLEVEA